MSQVQASLSAAALRIRVGIGGWNFEPWRDNFYPSDLPHHLELEYASRRVTAIEINSTYYGIQKPATFAKWREATPDGFLFSLKASRYATNRRVLSEAGDSVARFIDSGIAELGEKLGPIVWQFAPTKRFDPEDFEAFLALLPKNVDGRPLRHVVDVRHESFMTPAFLSLARRYQVATVFTDSDDYPSFADPTADFIYARLMRSNTAIPTGYPLSALQTLHDRAVIWAEGGQPDGLPMIEERQAPPAGGRDVFLYFINGAKERAPAAAQTLVQLLGFTPLAWPPA
ncbi:MAG TPA: DUF72 domain-containing protein [Oxalicibacterium sp.]|jgi:uncharacterized protein YecE (DUF72 family)|nr:DUF72 domain-containing protein [Oxalicibacterium sp.]